MLNADLNKTIKLAEFGTGSRNSAIKSKTLINWGYIVWRRPPALNCARGRGLYRPLPYPNEATGMTQTASLLNPTRRENPASTRLRNPTSF